MYSLYYDGFFEPRKNLPTNWHSFKYRLEKGIAITYHQQNTHIFQENFEVLVSCIVKDMSKSIYFKSPSNKK